MIRRPYVVESERLGAHRGGNDAFRGGCSTELRQVQAELHGRTMTLIEPASLSAAVSKAAAVSSSENSWVASGA